MSLHADEGNGFPLTRLHHFPAVLRATNLQLPVAVILSSTIYTKLDAITLITNRFTAREKRHHSFMKIREVLDSYKRFIAILDKL